LKSLIVATINNIFSNLHTEFHLVSVEHYERIGHLITISFNEAKASWLYADLAYILHGFERFFTGVEVDEVTSDHIVIYAEGGWFNDNQ
jgi:hypothetical protein